MTAAEQIQQWADLAAAAKPGPWGPGDAYFLSSPTKVDGYAFPAMRAKDQQETAANSALMEASPVAVPAMAAALQAVLALHTPNESYPAPRCVGCVDPLDQGWVYWPCATVRVISEALGVES